MIKQTAELYCDFQRTSSIPPGWSAKLQEHIGAHQWSPLEATALLVPHICVGVPQVLYGRRHIEGGYQPPSTMLLLYTYIDLSSGGRERLFLKVLGACPRK